MLEAQSLGREHRLAYAGFLITAFYGTMGNYIIETKKQTFEAHSVRKCASAIFVLRTSDISLMRYVASHAIYGFRREKRHEYNIAKAEGFYIAFAIRKNIAVRLVSQYRLSFLF